MDLTQEKKDVLRDYLLGQGLTLQQVGAMLEVLEYPIYLCETVVRLQAEATYGRDVTWAVVADSSPRLPEGLHVKDVHSMNSDPPPTRIIIFGKP